MDHVSSRLDGNDEGRYQKLTCRSQRLAGALASVIRTLSIHTPLQRLYIIKNFRGRILLAWLTWNGLMVKMCALLAKHLSMILHIDPRMHRAFAC